MAGERHGMCELSFKSPPLQLDAWKLSFKRSKAFLDICGSDGEGRF
jgi:hypothetical protein